MYKGAFKVNGLNNDKLYKLTFFCYDSLYFMKTKKLDKTGLNAVPLDDNDNYGLRKSKSQHWFKDNFNYLINENGDSVLIVDATYMTIDNAVMYQFRDFRLDTVHFLESENRYKNTIPFEKAVADGLSLKSLSWVDKKIRRRIEEVKQCVLRRKDGWESADQHQNDTDLEGK